MMARHPLSSWEVWVCNKRYKWTQIHVYFGDWCNKIGIEHNSTETDHISFRSNIFYLGTLHICWTYLYKRDKTGAVGLKTVQDRNGKRGGGAEGKRRQDAEEWGWPGGLHCLKTTTHSVSVFAAHPRTTSQASKYSRAPRGSLETKSQLMLSEWPQ